MITKRDYILSAIKAYVSQINLQHGTTTLENRKTTKVKRLQSKNGYDILITRLSFWFGIHGSVLSWFKSYLSSRCFRVKCVTDLSS